MVGVQQVLMSSYACQKIKLFGNKILPFESCWHKIKKARKLKYHPDWIIFFFSARRGDKVLIESGLKKSRAGNFFARWWDSREIKIQD